MVYVILPYPVGNVGEILLRQNSYNDIHYAGKYFLGQRINLPQNLLNKEEEQN